MNLQVQIQSILLRIQNDYAFKREFIKEPQSCLVAYGITDEAVQAELISVVASTNFIYQESVQNTMKVGDRFKESVKTSLNEIERGYKGSMQMYWIAFLTGVALIIAALVFAIVKKENLLSIVFGSLGTLDLLTFFIMKPPLELQNSRIGFARLEAAFMNWFIDMNNLNSLFTPLQVNCGGIAPPKDQFKMTDVEFEKFFKKCMDISDQSIKNTEKTLDMMGKIIREAVDKKAAENLVPVK